MTDTEGTDRPDPREGTIDGEPLAEREPREPEPAAEPEAEPSHGGAENGE